jgi:UDP-glucose:glycoprotein glucosyltransferase
MTKPRIKKAILSLVAVGLYTVSVNAETPTVDLTLVAPWSAPDLLVEIA